MNSIVTDKESTENHKLTDKTYWENFWDHIKLPVIAQPTKQVDALFKRILPCEEEKTLFEIGCAPGGWLIYFHNTFSYQVSGIEYADEAAALTEINLKSCNVDNGVVLGDFFEYNSDNKYDIVFSRGFIEHFSNYSEVVGKIAEHSRCWVVTIIPNIFGLNGWISKIFRPKVYRTHVPIGLSDLRKVHEDQNLEIVFCNYSPEFQISKPFQKTRFSKKYPGISRLLNSPVSIINKTVQFVLNKLKWHPPTKFFSPSVICISKIKSE